MPTGESRPGLLPVLNAGRETRAPLLPPPAPLHPNERRRINRDKQQVDRPIVRRGKGSKFGGGGGGAQKEVPISDRRPKFLPGTH